MPTDSEDQAEVLERWLEDYGGRADEAAAALGDLFRAAKKHWVFDEADNSLKISASREYLREQRAELPFRVLFFLYSSQFDKVVESQILDSAETRATLPQDLTPQQILDRKASLLESNFKALARSADVRAGHYTVALSANESLRELPLVWEVPVEDESKTGFPADYMWQMTFRFLCEISHALIAYGGYSAAFFEELIYIRNEPELSSRLLWLDQERRLYFPENDEETWPLTDIAEVLGKID